MSRWGSKLLDMSPMNGDTCILAAELGYTDINIFVI